MSNNTNCREIITQYFDFLGAKADGERLLGLMAENIVVETPFSPQGQPVHFEGKEQVAARFVGARDTMKIFGFYDIDILATEDPERWLATCKSRGESESGLKYENEYCWIFRIVDGKIVLWREYYNPQPLMPFLDAISMGS